jgi:hypothetical protein
MQNWPQQAQAMCWQACWAPDWPLGTQCSQLLAMRSITTEKWQNYGQRAKHCVLERWPSRYKKMSWSSSPIVLDSSFHYK